MAFAFGDWGSVLTESAFSRAFICLQSDSRVSRSDTRWGFFPILFNLRINTFSNFFNGNFKPKDPPCLFTHGLFLVWLLVYNLDFATKGGWINTHIFSSTCAEFLYLCLLWFTQGLKFFKLLLLCGDYRGYGCIGQSTENGIPGLRSRLPFAIYSQSKFHWSSLAKNHLKIQHIIIKLTQDYSHVALTKSCNTFWLISFIWKCHRLNYKKIIYSFQIFLTWALYDINWTHYRSGVLTWDHTGSFVVPNRLFSNEYFGTLWVVLGKVFERHLTDKSTNTHRHTNQSLLMSLWLVEVVSQKRHKRWSWRPPVDFTWKWVREGNIYQNFVSFHEITVLNFNVLKSTFPPSAPQLLPIFAGRAKASFLRGGARIPDTVHGRLTRSPTRLSRRTTARWGEGIRWILAMLVLSWYTVARKI